MSHDAAGRRQYEYDTAAPVNSRRDYVYLPAGQLGEIHGRDASGIPYVIVLTYGVGGRLVGVSDSRGDDYALYWDDAGRLAGALLTIQAKVYRWHFHYLGMQPIAATQENLGKGEGVMRYYLLQDRRGLVDAMVGADGGLFYLANHSAHAVPFIEINTSSIWNPFALPGQLEIPGTESLDGRSALMLTGARVMVPVHGVGLRRPAGEPHRERSVRPRAGSGGDRLDYDRGRATRRGPRRGVATTTTTCCA